MSVANTAQRYIGYLEHKTPELLYVPVANVGTGNYTAFADTVWRVSRRNLAGVPWCVTFVYAVFAEALGYKKAVELIGKPCAGVRTLRRKLRRRKRLMPPSYRPRRGDIMLMTTHAGIVYRVLHNGFLTIDGNTVDETGHFPPTYGGAVALRWRKFDDSRIIGYGNTHEEAEESI